MHVSYVFSCSSLVLSLMRAVFSLCHWVVLLLCPSATWIVRVPHIRPMRTAIFRRVCTTVRNSCRFDKFIFVSHPSLDQEWKHSCYLHCLAPVLDAVSQPSVNYETVQDLDKRIRDFSIPVPLRNKDAHSRSIIMQRASLSIVLEAGQSLLLKGFPPRISSLHCSITPTPPPILYARSKWT